MYKDISNCEGRDWEYKPTEHSEYYKKEDVRKMLKNRIKVLFDYGYSTQFVLNNCINHLKNVKTYTFPGSSSGEKIKK